MNWAVIDFSPERRTNSLQHIADAVLSDLFDFYGFPFVCKRGVAGNHKEVGGLGKVVMISRSSIAKKLLFGVSLMFTNGSTAIEVCQEGETHFFLWRQPHRRTSRVKVITPDYNNSATTIRIVQELKLLSAIFLVETFFSSSYLASFFSAINTL